MKNRWMAHSQNVFIKTISDKHWQLINSCSQFYKSSLLIFHLYKNSLKMFAFNTLRAVIL